jgi:NADP-dependent 3-hydroxy acid dehydrogenase YdfG
MEQRSLSGRTVAISGGAQGIGRVTARALIAKGARVAIGDIDLPLAEKTALELGGNAIALPLDVTDRESFATFLDEAERQLGPLDVVINNAGIMPVGLFSEEDDDSTRRQIDINIHGVITGSKLAIERMLPRRTGHIINIASQAGKAGVPGVATYSGTKHAVIGLSEAMRSEIRDTGIEVSVVMPALVNTELSAGAKEVRLVKTVEPEDVAAGIVATLEKPRFEVWVPNSSKFITAIVGLLPYRGREAIARLLKVDSILLDVDEKAREAYEQRAAESEPSVDEKQAVS